MSRRASERGADGAGTTASPRLPPSVTPARFAKGDVELDQPHADPDRELRDKDGVAIGFHEIRTARVCSGPDYLLARRTIDREHWEVAQRYLAVVAAMGGVRDGEWGAGVRLPPHQQGHPSEAMVDAHSAMRAAIEGVGKGPMGIIGAVCLDGVTMAGLSLLVGEHEKQVIGRLKAALERLGEVWGGVRVRPAGARRQAAILAALRAGSGGWGWRRRRVIPVDRRFGRDPRLT